MTTALRGGASAEAELGAGIQVQHQGQTSSVGQVYPANGRGAHESLFRFTDRLFRARSLSDVYDSALDAILEVLGCERAAVLIFDDAGVMRFVAWRELSEQYRRAVEGHSPWTREVKDPQPICIEDVDAADLPESLKATVKAEGIGCSSHSYRLSRMVNSSASS